MSSRRRTLAATATLLALLAACNGDSGPPAYRAQADGMRFRITAERLPPIAREDDLYKVVVSEAESGSPIEGGEGRIFASSRDGASTWDILTPGPELGTYYGTLNFVHAGEWAIAIEFRRDSTQKLGRIDWMQEVRAGSQ